MFKAAKPQKAVQKILFPQNWRLIFAMAKIKRRFSLSINSLKI